MGIRSIPASAGEPFTRTEVDRYGAVYPRECGGATTAWGDVGRDQGLSPRVRGSPGHDLGLRVEAGSIPASAGEPEGAKPTMITLTVYPRECGGAAALAHPVQAAQGLSRECGGAWLCWPH